jgi:hypothetical protein
MESRLETANGAEVQRKEIEEQGSITLSGQRDHLALVWGIVEDHLQVCGLPTQTGAVVNQLAIDLAGGKVNEAQTALPGLTRLSSR